MASIVNATTSTGLVQTADNSGSLQLQTNNGTTAVTIDTSQNVGIGTSSPQARLHQNSTNDGVQAIFTGAQTGTTQTILLRSQYHTNNGTAGFANIGWFDNGSQGGGITFGTTSNGSGTTGTPTERMRIQANGFVGIGTTSSGYPLQVSYSSNTGPGVGILDTTPQNGNTFIQFRNNATTCGNITSNGTNSTTYGTSSDYRLKENIEPMNNALAKVAQLKPVTYTWKADGSVGQGFIAHELQAVVPDCVVGEKDAVDEEGNPKYQNVDTSYLVATLTAAIQELKAELDATKAEVQALKGAA